MTAYNPEDLDQMEVVVLGVLCVGLPPARAAGSDTFRFDHVAAVVAGLATDGDRESNLGPDGVHVTREFGTELKATIQGLVEKGLVAHQESGMPAAAGTFDEGLALDLVNPDEHPAVLDRYLAQLCMEELFNIPAVYPVLMERYAASGEVWRRLREGGYAQ
jgi:hypothetical protein